VSLPGTIYLAQGGALYRFRAGTFTRLTAAEGWTEPAESPDGASLVAVKRALNFSDLYLLDTAGNVKRQLTHNASGVVERNHWAFYPRFSHDGQTVFYAYDPKDPYNSYRVDLAIYATPLGATAAPKAWTSPNYYTGGDVTPLPVESGALIYTKYSIDQQGQVHSQVWVQARAGSVGVGLTKPEDDCQQPAISPQGTTLAMVCRHGQTIADLEVAPLNLASFSIGPPIALVPAGLLAAPAFSPDGQTLAYFAPASGDGPLQLWTVGMQNPAAASASPVAPAPALPRRITSSLAFDSTAAPAWS